MVTASGSTDPRYAAVLDALRGVHWPARRAVRGGASGTHHSRMRGAAPEFSEYRRYRQGDDPRRIDWKLLARSDRAYIRLANDRAVLATTIVVDASASMAFPVATLGKWRLAKELAVGLASVAHADGDPVGLIVGGVPSPRLLAPRTRRGVLAEIARVLDAAGPAGAAAVAPALAAARGVARVALITDFLGDGEPLLAAAREHLAAGGEVHAIHVLAREEIEPDARAILATDPERPDLRRPLVAATRDAYLAGFAAWRDELAATWRAAGATFTAARTDEPAHVVVRRITAPAGALAMARS
jgi:uncharacterized protein (DUF58 family)